MLPPETGRARRPGRVIEQAVERGLDRAELLAAASLTEEELADPDSRVPAFKRFKLWSFVDSKIGNPDLGLEFGSRVRIQDGGVLGYAYANSGTLGKAYRRLVRFSRIACETMEIKLETEPGRWHLIFSRIPLLEQFRIPIDEDLATIVTFSRMVTAQEISPAELRLPYRRPDDLTALRSFFHCPISFENPGVRMVFHERDMNLPLIDADEILGGYLIQLAERILESLPRDKSFAQSVSRAMWPSLSEGKPGIEEIASTLAVSPRTLQRRLREEGTTFGNVLDKLRRGMALQLLQDKDLAVYEVAFLLGYSEPSTFYRAFRRWQSTSPLEFRQSIN